MLDDDQGPRTRSLEEAGGSEASLPPSRRPRTEAPPQNEALERLLEDAAAEDLPPPQPLVQRIRSDFERLHDSVPEAMRASRESFTPAGNLGRTAVQRSEPYSTPARNTMSSWFANPVDGPDDDLEDLDQTLMDEYNSWGAMMHFEAEAGTVWGTSSGSRPSKGAGKGAQRGGEISLKSLDEKTRAQFKVSDGAEWGSMLETKAVKVLSVAESREMRRRYPDRIMGSRMVRRLKPQEGLDVPP